MKYQFAILFLFVQLFTAFNSLFQPSLAATPHSNVLSQGGVITKTEVNEIVDFPEVGLLVPKPDGFEKATSFHGFQQVSSSSSILLIKVPGPFSKIQNSVNKSNFRKANLSLISKQSIKINNQNGLLLKVEQTAFGQKVQKWIVMFGYESNTYTIIANFLKENAPKLSELMKKSILASTISLSSPTVSTLPFTTKAVDGLIMVQSLSGLGKIAGFTKDGRFSQRSPQDPLFLVAPSLGDVLVLDSKSFANRRLYQHKGTKIRSIKSTNEITIDNLSGWEIEAIGQDQKTKTPLKIYQVMLFPEKGGYILMTGIVGEKQAKLYLPKFKAIAQTYQNSPPGSQK
jgi:hypothetical protein